MRGLCAADDGGRLTTGVDTTFGHLSRGHRDAVLMPIHVDRGYRRVAERLAGQGAGVDIARVQAWMERPRFLVPDDLA